MTEEREKLDIYLHPSQYDESKRWVDELGEVEAEKRLEKALTKILEDGSGVG